VKRKRRWDVDEKKEKGSPEKIRRVKKIDRPDLHSSRIGQSGAANQKQGTQRLAEGG